MSIDNLTPAALWALHKEIAKAAEGARECLEDGTTYAVNETFTCTVTGEVKVSETPAPKIPTVSIPFKEVLTLFVARSGFTREHTLALLTECLTDAMSAGKSAIGSVPEVDEAFALVTAEFLKGLPPRQDKAITKVKARLS